MGSNKEISTSKMRKIMEIIINCNEKGNREIINGLNPHSNGDFFSRLLKDFLEIIKEIIKSRFLINNSNSKIKLKI